MAWRVARGQRLDRLHPRRDRADGREARRARSASSSRASGRRATRARRSRGGRRTRWTRARIATLKAFVEDGMKQYAVPGVGLSLPRRRQGRVGRRPRREGARQEPTRSTRTRSSSRRRTPRRSRRCCSPSSSTRSKLRWDEPVTEVLPGVPARRRGHDEAGAREAPRLRVHGPAAAGHGVALRVQERDAGVGARPSRRRCSRRASSARSSSTATSWRPRRGSSEAPCRIPGASWAPRTTRR